MNHRIIQRLAEEEINIVTHAAAAAAPDPNKAADALLALADLVEKDLGQKKSASTARRRPAAAAPAADVKGADR